jgi:hypothetical protein
MVLPTVNLMVLLERRRAAEAQKRALSRAELRDHDSHLRTFRLALWWVADVTAHPVSLKEADLSSEAPRPGFEPGTYRLTA